LILFEFNLDPKDTGDILVGFKVMSHRPVFDFWSILKKGV
jgi:hypothetical protein